MVLDDFCTTKETPATSEYGHGETCQNTPNIHRKLDITMSVLYKIIRRPEQAAICPNQAGLCAGGAKFGVANHVTQLYTLEKMRGLC